jgi:hypothetical protein
MLRLAWYERRASAVPPMPGMQGDKLIRQLLVLRHPDRGFYLEYSDRQRGTWLSGIDPAGDMAAWVPTDSQGEGVYILSACLLPLSVCERVVTDFFVAGEQTQEIGWVSFEPLRPRREQPPG